nr:MAG TPA: hypothetical protein [Caudoviricetes sp.]
MTKPAAVKKLRIWQKDSRTAALGQEPAALEYRQKKRE